MARFYENDRNTPPPRPPRPMPPGDVASKPKPRKDSGQGGVSKEESKSRLRDAQRLMPMPRPSKSRPLPPGLEGQDRLMPMPSRRAPMSMPPGLEGQQYLAPGGMGADTFLDGMGQNVMPDFSNAEIPGVNFIRDMMMGGGAQDGGMPLPRSFDPGTDALLRAYMRQMQGGE